MNIQDYAGTHIIIESEQEVTDMKVILESLGLRNINTNKTISLYDNCDMLISTWGDWYGVWPKCDSSHPRLRAETFIERYYEHQ